MEVDLRTIEYSKTWCFVEYIHVLNRIQWQASVPFLTWVPDFMCVHTIMWTASIGANISPATSNGVFSIMMLTGQGARKIGFSGGGIAGATGPAIGNAGSVSNPQTLVQCDYPFTNIAFLLNGPVLAATPQVPRVALNLGFLGIHVSFWRLKRSIPRSVRDSTVPGQIVLHNVKRIMTCDFLTSIVGLMPPFNTIVPDAVIVTQQFQNASNLGGVGLVYVHVNMLNGESRYLVTAALTNLGSAAAVQLCCNQDPGVLMRIADPMRYTASCFTGALYSLAPETFNPSLVADDTLIPGGTSNGSDLELWEFIELKEKR